jgi:hypothetical protein
MMKDEDDMKGVDDTQGIQRFKSKSDKMDSKRSVKNLFVGC